MGRKSSVKTKLSSQVLAELNNKLMEGRFTQAELLRFIRGKFTRPEEAPSASALGRYARNFEKTARKIRERREVATALVQELGPESVDGKQGRLNVEMLRGLVFDLQLRLDGMNAETMGRRELESLVEMVQRLSRTSRELAQAIRMEQDFANKIREEERKRALAEVQARVDELCSAEDLKKLSHEELKEKIAALAAE